MAAVRIFGIDPGSRLTGFGALECDRHGRLHYLTSGCIRLSPARPLAERLRELHANLADLLVELAPQEVSIERVFMARNADSALKLGHARGVAMLAAAQCELPVIEYAPRQIKQAVVGHGGAEKSQVQHMVATLLGLPARPQADAADALAAALCHAHCRALAARLAG